MIRIDRIESSYVFGDELPTRLKAFVEGEDTPAFLSAGIDQESALERIAHMSGIDINDLYNLVVK